MTEQDRAEFEAIVSRSPYERSVERYPDDARNHSWPNGYREYTVQFAYDVCGEMFAARRTQDAKVRELVEAVVKYGKAMHARLVAEAVDENGIAVIENVLYDNEEIAATAMFDLAAQLKEQDDA